MYLSSQKNKNFQKHYSGKEYRVGLTFSLSIFDGGLTASTVSENQAPEEKTSYALEAMQDNVQILVHKYFSKIINGSEIRKILESTEKSLQSLVKSNQPRESFEEQILDMLFKTRCDLAEAKYNVIISELRLKEIAEDPQNSDIEKANNLLEK